MKKLFYSILSALVIVFVGCDSTDSQSDQPVLSGTFQHAEDVNGTMLTLQVIFDDASYTAKGYVGSGIGSTCQIFEETGAWKIEANNFKKSGSQNRFRESCEATFSSFESTPDEASGIRNISSKSFELHEESDSETPAQWVKYTKI